MLQRSPRDIGTGSSNSNDKTLRQVIAALLVPLFHARTKVTHMFVPLFEFNDSFKGCTFHRFEEGKKKHAPTRVLESNGLYFLTSF